MGDTKHVISDKHQTVMISDTHQACSLMYDRHQTFIWQTNYPFAFFRLPENFEHINNLNETDLQKYVVAGVTIVNLTSMTVMKTIFLDLTMVIG